MEGLKVCILTFVTLKTAYMTCLSTSEAVKCHILHFNMGMKWEKDAIKSHPAVNLETILYDETAIYVYKA